MFPQYSFALRLAICYEFQASYRLATWLAIYFIFKGSCQKSLEIPHKLCSKDTFHLLLHALLAQNS